MYFRNSAIVRLGVIWHGFLETLTRIFGRRHDLAAGVLRSSLVQLFVVGANGIGTIALELAGNPAIIY